MQDLRKYLVDPLPVGARLIVRIVVTVVELWLISRRRYLTHVILEHYLVCCHIVPFQGWVLIDWVQIWTTTTATLSTSHGSLKVNENQDHCGLRTVSLPSRRLSPLTLIQTLFRPRSEKRAP